jgi:predicted amidohydrolase YtcJ
LARLALRCKWHLNQTQEPQVDTPTPNQADLDTDDVVRGRPVILQSKDCHALWVSSSLLEVSMPFPEAIDGGVIMRNGSGHPTGKHLLVFKPLPAWAVVTGQR